MIYRLIMVEFFVVHA